MHSLHSSTTLTHTHTHSHTLTPTTYLHDPTHFQCLLRRLLSKQKIEKFLLKRKQIEKAFWGGGEWAVMQAAHTHTHTDHDTHAQTHDWARVLSV